MRSRLHLHKIPSWTTNITPKRRDSLPYSKIENICYEHRQRLLAARTAPPISPSRPPPAAFFVCQPTPSYAVSPQLAARLSKSQMTSLQSKLWVYENTSYWTEDGGHLHRLEQHECTPEVQIDQNLSGECALYYGHGQLHVVGMLDMHRSEVNEGFDSNLLASEIMVAYMGCQHDGIGVVKVEEAGSWIHCMTKQGTRKMALVTTDVDLCDGIATASVTLNTAVPVQGVDPDRLCPHIRLATLGIETGPFTSLLAKDGTPAPFQGGLYNRAIIRQKWADVILLEMTLAMGIESRTRIVDYVYALGQSDPDLELDDGDSQWLSELWIMRMKYYR